MASADSTQVPADRFDDATLKIEGAKAIISALGIFVEGCGSKMPITGTLMSQAMNGVRMLLDSATDDLCAKSCLPHNMDGA